MYLPKLLKYSLLPVLIVLSGCQTENPTANSGTASAVDQVLQQIKTSVNSMQVAQTNLVAAQAAADSNHRVVGQFVADRMDEARYANTNNAQPNGATALVEDNLGPASTALGIQPSADVKLKEVVDLKLALSQAQSDKVTLQTEVTAETAQANQMSGQATLLAVQVKDKETALAAAAQASNAQVTQLANVSAQVKINAAEADAANQEKVKQAAANERLSVARWFMIFGGIFLAIGVGLSFIHVPDTLGIGASVGGTMLAVGWLVSYVEDLLQQTWFRYVIDGSILLGLGAIGWIGYRAWQHRQQTATTATVATNLVGAIQEAANDDKKTGTTTAAALQPYLQSWHVTATGATDTAAVKSINQTATALNLTNPGEVSAATGTPAVVATIPSPVAPVAKT
jgi:hypothetical protein